MRHTTLMIAAMTVMLAACSGSRNGDTAEGGGNVEALIVEGGETADSLSVPAQQTSANIGRPASPVSQTMGKVVAGRFADLSFQTALPIERVLVRNGQHVRRGQVLAQLDQFKLRNTIEQQRRAIEQAQLQIEQARLQMQDVIIAQGYDPDKAAAVPQQVLHNADVKSGYALAKSQLATARTQLAAAQHELNSGELRAPFDGVVANVTVQAHQLAQAGQPVCRVIAQGDMAVEFRVMETDLSRYRVGTAVTVIPVADQSQHYAATVSEINPIVDQQGAVTLRARIDEPSSLFDGMNVVVFLNSL